MVLTAEELVSAAETGKRDLRIYSALYTRRITNNFSEQAACDREIQRYLLRRGTIAYKFNCNVIHQPWKFKQISPVTDHGWGDDGPTNDKLMTIYRSLPIYEKKSDGEKDQVNNLSNNNTAGVCIGKFVSDVKSNKIVYSDPPEYKACRKDAAVYPDNHSESPGCFSGILSCLFL